MLDLHCLPRTRRLRLFLVVKCCQQLRRPTPLTSGLIKEDAVCVDGIELGIVVDS